jgi:hypothetical protein
MSLIALVESCGARWRTIQEPRARRFWTRSYQSRAGDEKETWFTHFQVPTVTSGHLLVPIFSPLLLVWPSLTSTGVLAKVEERGFNKAKQQLPESGKKTSKCQSIRPSHPSTPPFTKLHQMEEHGFQMIILYRPL